MSFLSMFDPTSSSSPLGGLVRSGISALPGGSTAMGVVDSYNANKRTTDRAAATDRSTPAAPAAEAAPPWYRRTWVLVSAGVAVVGLVLVLVVIRRRR